VRHARDLGLAFASGFGVALVASFALHGRWPLWLGLGIGLALFLVGTLGEHRNSRGPEAKRRRKLLLKLDIPFRELDALLGIVQSDAPGYSVPTRRKELTEITQKIRAFLKDRPDLRALYESPRPGSQPDGQLMDHDEHIFEGELEHRLDMVAEIRMRLSPVALQSP
jgi:hypothetical protein